MVAAAAASDHAVTDDGAAAAPSGGRGRTGASGAVGLLSLNTDRAAFASARDLTNRTLQRQKTRQAHQRVTGGVSVVQVVVLRIVH